MKKRDFEKFNRSHQKIKRSDLMNCTPAIFLKVERVLKKNLLKQKIIVNRSRLPKASVHFEQAQKSTNAHPVASDHRARVYPFFSFFVPFFIQNLHFV
jgi:hypothetical protein